MAGMAALVRQRFPDYTPAQVAAYLKYHAQQRVTPDPNNTWGHGFAQLPSPDREALVALYNATGGANWLAKANWMTSSARPCLRGTASPPTAAAGSPDWTFAINQLTRDNHTQRTGQSHQPARTAPHPEPIERGHTAGVGEPDQFDGLGTWRNQLTGPIPTSLGGLTNLEGVYLWGNELTGSDTCRTGQPRQPGTAVT